MNVRPFNVARVIVPDVNESVICTAFEPASASLMLIALPLALDKVRGVSSAVVWAAGTALTGG